MVENNTRRTLLYQLTAIGVMNTGIRPVTAGQDTSTQPATDLPVRTLNPEYDTTGDTPHVTFRGELTDLGAYERVEQYFEWREAGDTYWDRTAIVTKTQPGMSSHRRPIDDNTVYQYRNVIETADTIERGLPVTADFDPRHHGTDYDIDFISCHRVEVTGEFDADDAVYASTGFYTDIGYGNTIAEDGIRFGDDVEAPFTGTVILEIGEVTGDASRTIERDDDELTVIFEGYSSEGTVLTGISLNSVAGTTHGNPHGNRCLTELDPDSDASELEADFAVTVESMPTEFTAGDSYTVRVEIVNIGSHEGTIDVTLVVGHNHERVDSTSVTLDGGERTELTLGYEPPTLNTDQEFPVRIEATDIVIEESVLMYGVGRVPEFEPEIIDTNAPVAPGETLEVTAEITNLGATDGTREIELRQDLENGTETVDTQTLTLEGDETETRTFTYEVPSDANTNEFRISVSTGDWGTSTNIPLTGGE